MTDKKWAIKYEGGFYNGTRGTRVEAIAVHVSAFDVSLPSWACGSGLTTQQRDAWNARKKKGDRCVRVEIIEVFP